MPWLHCQIRTFKKYRLVLDYLVMRFIMKQKKVIPALSKAIRATLELFAKSRTLQARVVERAKVVMLSSEGLTDAEVSAKVDLHESIVGKWRRRFSDAYETLEGIESEVPEKLGEAVTDILLDKPRSGAPETYDANQRALIVTMACQNPEDYGFEISHWSLPYLKIAIEQAGFAPGISESSINRILNDVDVRPHKHQYWLHSREKYESPETYNAKIDAINSLYRQAKETASAPDKNDGTRILSTDEMTGIQALEHKYPDKLPTSGKDAKIEFEYIRHGTTSLIGFFDVITGRVEPPFLNQTRTEDDFVKALNEVISRDPSKRYCIIADNLNTHESESLVRYVAEQIGDKQDLGMKGKSGILKSKESRAQYLSDTDHRICFYYTPIHCSWMNQIEIWFGIINKRLLKKSFKSVEELIQSIITFVEQYNRYFAHPFNWKYGCQ